MRAYPDAGDCDPVRYSGVRPFSGLSGDARRAVGKLAVVEAEIREHYPTLGQTLRSQGYDAGFWCEREPRRFCAGANRGTPRTRCRAPPATRQQRAEQHGTGKNATGEATRTELLANVEAIAAGSPFRKS
jgi:hypothetical protein